MYGFAIHDVAEVTEMNQPRPIIDFALPRFGLRRCAKRFGELWQVVVWPTDNDCFSIVLRPSKQPLRQLLEVVPAISFGHREV